jgi:hypothetical protein
MLRLQPIKVATTSTDEDGMLIFDGQHLVAVIVRLEARVHGDRYAGKWNLEATFDHLPYPPDKVFDDLDHAQSWISAKLGRPVYG